MRISEDFVMREIAGEYVIVPVGNTASNFVGLISTNEIGSIIFEALSNECTLEDLTKLIINQYEVETEVAERDISEFLQQLKDIQALIY